MHYDSDKGHVVLQGTRGMYYVMEFMPCDIPHGGIPHGGIVCDITLVQNFFFDITSVLSKATPTLPKPHAMCHHCSCQAHKKPRLVSGPC